MFDASEINFVVSWMSTSKWESKVNSYKKWGWSEEEVLKAFKKSPQCMLVSKDNKLLECMDFFINRECVGSLRRIVESPAILNFSSKRVLPRCSVFRVSLSKRSVKLVAPYKEEVPELLKLYKQKLDLSKIPEDDDKV